MTSTPTDPAPDPRSSGGVLRWVLVASAATAVLTIFWFGFFGSSEGSHAAPPVRREPLLPKFAGPLLDGEKSGSDALSKRRGLIFVFNSRDDDAERAAGLVAKLAPLAREQNIVVMGIARDGDADDAKIFARGHGLAFPIVHDPSGTIGRKLRVEEGKSAVLVIDPEGYITGGFIGLADADAKLVDYYEAQFRDLLYLPERGASVTPELGLLPEAPPFSLKRLGSSDDAERLELVKLRGKVVVLAFFLPTCPHCHDILKFLDKLSAKLANPDLVIVPISVNPSSKLIQNMVEDFSLSLSMYTDPGGKAQSDYAHRFAVPDLLVIGRDGRVRGRRTGSDGRVQTILTMEINAALGVADQPILLSRSGYSGSETCSVCHTEQHATWTLTNHAYAFETLVKHGEDRNEECVGCHVVGWNEPGGFDPVERQPHLQGVQCENCHGRGGPHQSPKFAEAGYEKVCLGCHTPEHSLRFSFADRLPLVSHAANMQFASLSLTEREALLARRDVRQRELFDKGEFVGSDACKSCHAKEHALWEGRGHALAFKTLRTKNEERNGACQKCHTTGFGEPGGFPAGGDATAGVGCESCHGPGGEHVKQGAVRNGTILALTDKCDSCVIMQICGSCHDEANDPGFEFELVDKLHAIRHGFREVKAAAE